MTANSRERKTNKLKQASNFDKKGPQLNHPIFNKMYHPINYQNFHISAFFVTRLMDEERFQRMITEIHIGTENYLANKPLTSNEKAMIEFDMHRFNAMLIFFEQDTQRCLKKTKDLIHRQYCNIRDNNEIDENQLRTYLMTPNMFDIRTKLMDIKYDGIPLFVNTFESNFQNQETWLLSPENNLQTGSKRTRTDEYQFDDITYSRYDPRDNKRAKSSQQW